SAPARSSRGQPPCPRPTAACRRWRCTRPTAETRPGDILGEMSLLDSGIRFSACTTLTDCEIAVLSAEAMDDMMTKDPQLAASLIALLARKLSLRLRVVSARLSDNQK
ncbi:cyclic nucleotide-binding domain-containing protein, partial [Acidovorax sp. NPDC077664]|uniref:cyclic nucleotide-binding domain-containing protein n=1 Tax=Acidovorax sp. NPDC077664 TaxID=3390544 RepID=UPI003D01DDD3